MTIFRNKNDQKLYTIERVSPRMYTGSWHEAKPLFPNQGTAHLNARGKIKKINLSDFVPVAHA